jgi:hypothetical protein
MNPSRRHGRRFGRSLRAAVPRAGGASLLALLGIAACGVDNEIVGGACSSGYSPCGDTCCRDEMDAGRPNGSKDASGDAHPDGREADGKTHDRQIEDSRVEARSSTDAPEDGAADACAAPYDSVDHCGACDVACKTTDVCSPSDAGTFQCAPFCPPELSDCGGTCVDESTDPDNCGACGKICPSGFCAAGKCQGTTPGDIVVIGYDYRLSKPRVAEATILSNAAFLPSSDPVRILSFERYADLVAVSNVKSILAGAATALHRMPPVITVSTDDTDIPNKLAIGSFDELIVYDQEAAPPNVLGPMGATWAATLATFTAAGGVIVSLDGAAGAAPQMPDFNTSARLLAIDGDIPIPKSTALDVIAPGDVVGSGVVTPFASEEDSVSFETSVPNGGDVTYVVVDRGDAGQAPVVVHVDVP